MLSPFSLSLGGLCCVLFVNYDDMMDKRRSGTVWRYSGEGYSMEIQWRRVQYGDTVEKGTVCCHVLLYVC